MEITDRQEGDVIVLTLNGRLDLASGAKMKEIAKKHFANNKTSLLLNLSGVEFVNSSGLGSLVSIMKEVRVLKGRLSLSNLDQFVQELLDITQLSQIFEVFPTEEEALASHRTPITG